MQERLPEWLRSARHHFEGVVVSCQDFLRPCSFDDIGDGILVLLQKI